MLTQKKVEITAFVYVLEIVREGILRKKTAALLDFVQITSPPSPPNLDNLYNFFSDVEIQELKASLGL